MSLTHCIRTSIDLKDKNIFFEKNFCQEESIKGVTAKVFYAVLTYTPKACHSCGVKNQEARIVKNGFLKTRIKWISSAHYPTYLSLKKQRFLCRECQATFVAQSFEIEKHCFVANRVKQSIAIELADTLSMKDLAKRHFVSPTTIVRVLTQIAQNVTNRFTFLPKHLSFDEFKSVKSVSGKMSFIYADSASHALLDILPDRRLDTLRAHFLRYPLATRQQVKSIVVDMNAGYFTLAKELFPQAHVIIDHFHLIQLINRSLNITRVQTMKNFRTSKPADQKDYRKLKKYWRLFLKDSQNLDSQEYRYQRFFKKPMPESEVMDYLLGLDQTLIQTYHLYQNLFYCCKKNDYQGFKDLLAFPKRMVSEAMATSLRTLVMHQERIKNTSKFPFSNGGLEGSINKIKVIKRVSYGYRSFWNFKYRILLSFQHKKQKSNENQSILVA